MMIDEANQPSIGDLCVIVDPRKAFPHVPPGEILYSNLEGDVRVRLHSFPMYIVMFVDSNATNFMHPNDIEGVSLVDRKPTGDQK